MGELRDLIGIFGAVDRAIATNPELAERAATLLGPYREGGAVGWFDGLTRWTASRTGIHPGEQYPELDAALAGLADTPVDGRMAARRLLAVGTASRVIDRLGPGGADEALVHDALVAPGLAPDRDVAQALVGLLHTHPLTAAGGWAELLEQARDAELLPEMVTRQAGAPPCTGRLVALDDGSGAPVATLSSWFCTDQLTLDEAKVFLEPSNWPRCNPLWCKMEKQEGTSAAGNPIYHEVVSVDCEHPDEVWTAEVCLEFAFVDLPGGGAIVSYDLCEGSPQPGDAVLVDSGSLVVYEQNGKVCVRTTKRIKFDHPFSGQALAMVACVLGYGTVAEDLVFSCAHVADEAGAHQGTPFPGTTPERDPELGQAHGGGSEERPKATRPEGNVIDEVVQAAVTAATGCIEDCAQTYLTAYEKAAAGTYRADDLIADGTAMATRALRDAGLLVDLGLKATQAMSRGRSAEQAEQAEQAGQAGPATGHRADPPGRSG